MISFSDDVELMSKKIAKNVATINSEPVFEDYRLSDAKSNFTLKTLKELCSLADQLLDRVIDLDSIVRKVLRFKRSIENVRERTKETKLLKN